MPGKSHGLRSLVGYNPSGSKESGTTKQLHFTLGSPRTFWLRDSLKGFTELRKPIIFTVMVYYQKRYKLKTAKEEVHREEIRKH